MKRTFYYIINVIIVQLILSNGFVYAQNNSSNKHALIIAISEYEFGTGWPMINAHNDIPLIKSALTNQGFKDKDINVLKEEEATKEGILEAFDNLHKKVTEGDYVVIHYSGHGQRISDDDNDEIDGLDESLVPYDAPGWLEDGYKGEKHLRDDEFGLIINKLRIKLGKNGQVAVFIDACHSGSGTRGRESVRGGKEPLIIPNSNNKKGNDNGSGMVENIDEDSSEKAPFVLFTATQFDELDHETINDENKPVGPLSYAISKVFTDIKPNDTYLSVFARISNTMAITSEQQSPSIEGDINYKIFNGETVEQQPYYNVEDTGVVSLININAGYIHDLGNGDKVGLYKSGTQQTKGALPIAEGTIIKTNSFKSIVKLKKELAIKHKRQYWAFIESQKIRRKEALISLDSIQNNNLKKKIRGILREEKIKPVKYKNSTLYLKEKEQYVEFRKTSTGILFAQVNLTSIQDSLLIIEERYRRYILIKQLKLEDENYSIKLEMIPVNLKRDKYGVPLFNDIGNVIAEKEYSANDLIINGNICVDLNDTIQLNITNTGKESCYFNLIELSPDGVVHEVLPNELFSSAKDLKLEPGKSFKSYITAYGPPYGIEIYKIFATPKPIDLSSVITTRGKSDTKGGSPFESLINNSYQRTRGEREVESINKNEVGSVSTLTFIITDKKK